MVKTSSYRFPPVASRAKSLIHAGQFIKNPFPILEEAIQRLGTTYTFFMGGMQKAVLTTDPDAIRHILQKNHKAYEKSSLVTEILAKYLGKGLLTSTGDHWLKQRRLIQPGFTRKRIEGLQTLMQAELDAYMQRWKIYAKNKSVVDAYVEMNQLTFRIIARALFSTSIEEHGLSELSRMISILQAFIIREVRQPYKRWWFSLSGAIKRHIAFSKQARDLIRTIIHERKKSAQRPDDLLMMLLEARYENSDEGMNEEQLIDECLILFVAGHETSANALAWMFYLLGKNPEETERIRSASDEEQAGLIRNTITETLRLYPPAWVVDRISLEDDVVNGYVLPKGTVWILYLRGMHRHPEYWKEPQKFMPDRWMDPGLNKEAFLPFGAGPRLCIGEHFAWMEMQLIMTQVLRQWDFQLLSEEVPEQPLVTLRPAAPILITLSPRG